MNKAVMISIRPKWIAKIARGEKTIEVRKSRPKLDPPFKCYIYCTRSTDHPAGWLGCYDHDRHKFGLISPLNIEAGKHMNIEVVSGMVVGEFICDSVEAHDLPYPAYQSEVPSALLENACLSYTDLHRYIGSGGRFYGWHISDLKIYDEPKELSEFTKPCPEGHNCAACSWYFPGIQDYGRCEPPCCGFWESDDSLIARPPQSWMYVEEL